MLKKSKPKNFKKKDYLQIVRYTRDYLQVRFGYEKKLKLFETRLENGTLMCFVHAHNRYAILFDYAQFKFLFGHNNYGVQLALASSITAHEMRHYYQHRQMSAIKPRESEETIALWRYDEENFKNVDEVSSLTEFCTQPLELDAFLFEYIFCAENFDVFLTPLVVSKKHFDEMEKLYVKYFGETNEDLFNDKVRKLIKLDE